MSVVILKAAPSARDIARSPAGDLASERSVPHFAALAQPLAATCAHQLDQPGKTSALSRDSFLVMRIISPVGPGVR